MQAWKWPSFKELRVGFPIGCNQGRFLTDNPKSRMKNVVRVTY